MLKANIDVSSASIEALHLLFIWDRSSGKVWEEATVKFELDGGCEDGEVTKVDPTCPSVTAQREFPGEKSFEGVCKKNDTRPIGLTCHTATEDDSNRLSRTWRASLTPLLSRAERSTSQDRQNAEFSEHACPADTS